MKQLHSSQRARRLTQDQRQLVENSPGDFIGHNLATPIKVSAEPTPFYMQPEKAFMPHLASHNGFPYQSNHLYSAANKPLSHPTPYREFAGASQAMPLQQFHNGAHSSALPSAKLRSAPVNGSDENIQLAQPSRLELLHGSSTASLHNGYRNGSRTFNKVGQRRGSQGQKAHGYNSGQQAQEEHHAMPHESYLNKPWRRGAQQDGVRQSSWCRNPVGPNYVEYIPCICNSCNERNRSIWVRVAPESPLMSKIEIQTLLKFGICSRFGQVEDAFQVPSHKKDTFIVRYDSSSPLLLNHANHL